IMVHIIDVNDNPPVFSHNVFTYLNVNENHDIADPIGRVQISDPDADLNGAYYVSCNSSLFRVEQGGDVYSLHQLDYETQHQHRIQVTATDLRGRFSCAYFVISVQNIHDEKPIFSKKFYQFEVDRNATTGYHIGQVFAYHPNGNALQFTMKSGTASPYFKMQQET
ncbi:protocadherin gamma-A4-like, partial [Anneissia japonica]|uniref:protocadherin gamma-A4-like n=1 Tax=Anneissia japonica TaxID=1529436 RepID=UPI001425765A